jgi:triacylglycerol lipase
LRTRIVQALRGAARSELAAFARQARLLHRDVTALHPTCAAGDDVVVLLHGLFATAGVLRPLRECLECAGPRTASFSYAPGSGVEQIASRLADLVARLPSGVRVHLIGHSMGGLVVRWYVQELQPRSEIVQTISLATPFDGVPRARLLPGPAGRDISPGSALLRRLRDSANGGVPHLSIAAGRDSMIPDGAHFVVGERAVIDDCGHNALLYDPRVAEILVERVRTARARADCAA